MTEPQSDLHGTGMVWVGDLSGFQVEHVGPGADVDQIAVIHRCGWRYKLHPADTYLGNITEKALEHRKAGCLWMTPTPGGLGEELRRRAGQ